MGSLLGLVEQINTEELMNQTITVERLASVVLSQGPELSALATFLHQLAEVLHEDFCVDARVTTDAASKWEETHNEIVIRIPANSWLRSARVDHEEEAKSPINRDCLDVLWGVIESPKRYSLEELNVL